MKRGVRGAGQARARQDGFLQLRSSRRKVMLSDESDELVDNRSAEKDDVIRSGETLASEIADWGDIKTASSFLKDGKNLPEHQSPPNRKPMFKKSWRHVTKLSPSQKMIRDFKKTAAEKLLSSPSCINVRNVVTEWQVLYTSQVTQKAKKFHDGFLKLILTGSEGRQVMLYDANRTRINSRFLKKHETICLGGSLALDGHLVEIEALHAEDCKPPVQEPTPRRENSKSYRRNEKKVGLKAIKNAAGGGGCFTPKNTIPYVGEPSSMVVGSNIGGGNRASRHMRPVYDILSALRRPNESNTVEPACKTPETQVNYHAEDCHPEDTREALDDDSKAVDSDQETKAIATEGGGIMSMVSHTSSPYRLPEDNCALKDQPPAEETIHTNAGAFSVQSDELPSFDLGF